MTEQGDAKVTAVKSVVAWAGVGLSKWLAAIGITSWSDFAAACAAVYSIFLICDWIAKKWKGRKRP